MSKENLYKTIIYSYLIILFLHFLAHRRYSIYPSLVFPAFSQAPNIEKSMQYSDITLYAITDKNELKALSKADFFTGYKKHVNYFLATIVRNEKVRLSKPSMLQAREEFLKYSLKQLEALYPKDSFKGLQIDQSVKSYDTKKMIFNANKAVVSTTFLYFTK